MITFEEARDIVAAHRAAAYPPEADFQVSPFGYDAGDRWVIISGSWPEIYGYRGLPDDYKYIRTEDGPRTSVMKDTGEYIEEWGSLMPDLQMTEVGEYPRMAQFPNTFNPSNRP